MFIFWLVVLVELQWRHHW